jgi:hypothetical protein
VNENLVQGACERKRIFAVENFLSSIIFLRFRKKQRYHRKRHVIFDASSIERIIPLTMKVQWAMINI